MKMKILIDTCIFISREGCDIKGLECLNDDFVKLFKIIQNHRIKCCIHWITIQEIQKSIPDKITQTIDACVREQTLSKTRVYPHLDTPDPYQEQSQKSKDYLDCIDPGRKASQHNKNDNILLYSAYRGDVSLFITEDKGLIKKAQRLGLQNVHSVKSALEYLKKSFPYFVSVCLPQVIVAPGDTLHIRGTATHNPGTLKMYLFGPNYFTAESIFVEGDDKSECNRTECCCYDKKLELECCCYDKKFDVPADLSPNQYYGIIQHPMYNDEFDVKLSSDGTYFCGSTTQDNLVVKGNNKLQGVLAANALTKMIDENNDDIYALFTFTVAAPYQDAVRAAHAKEIDIEIPLDPRFID